MPSPHRPSIYFRSGQRNNNKKKISEHINQNETMIETDLPAVFLQSCGYVGVFSTVDRIRHRKVMI